MENPPNTTYKRMAQKKIFFVFAGGSSSGQLLGFLDHIRGRVQKRAEKLARGD